MYFSGGVGDSARPADVRAMMLLSHSGPQYVPLKSYSKAKLPRPTLPASSHKKVGGLPLSSLSNSIYSTKPRLIHTISLACILLTNRNNVLTKTLPDAIIPPGSLILVTAANGLIASHIVDTLVAHHYRVRSTARSLARAQWMFLLLQKHGPDALELVEVPSTTAPDCYDAATHGAAALIHTACTMGFSGSPPPQPSRQPRLARARGRKG